VKNAESKTATAECPSGKVVINGGYNVGGNEGQQREVRVVRNQATDSKTWTVRAVEHTDIASEWELQAFAICGVVSP
jgi:predicted phage tail protein